jgi:hypothetical protein
MRWKLVYMYSQKIKECKQINACEDYPLGIGCTAIQPIY